MSDLFDGSPPVGSKVMYYAPFMCELDGEYRVESREMEDGAPALLLVRSDLKGSPEYQRVWVDLLQPPLMSEFCGFWVMVDPLSPT